MKLSNLIEVLQNHLDSYGDCEVVACTEDCRFDKKIYEVTGTWKPDCKSPVQIEYKED